MVQEPQTATTAENEELSITNSGLFMKRRVKKI